MKYKKENIQELQHPDEFKNLAFPFETALIKNLFSHKLTIRNGPETAI